MAPCSSRARFGWRAHRRDSCWRSSIRRNRTWLPGTTPTWQGVPSAGYSTDDLADVTRLAREARSAGIDAFDMSWQGPSDRRLEQILDAAQAAGIKACAFIESWDANQSHLIGQGADVETMTAHGSVPR